MLLKRQLVGPQPVKQTLASSKIEGGNLHAQRNAYTKVYHGRNGS